MGRLDGKVAIVTGGGQGIGRGIVLALAKEGAQVVIVGRTQAKLEGVANEVRALGGTAIVSVCDVGVEASVQQSVSHAVGVFGQIDILVNNAQAFAVGKGPHMAPLEEMSEEQWDITFQSGLKGTLYFCKAVFPHMRERGGKIINMGSAWGLIGKAGTADYNACKEAIRGLTMTAAREWGKYAINVNVICPSTIESEPVLDWYELHPGSREAAVRMIPMRRAGHPEQDVGRVAVFLASSDSDFITGHTFLVDGGVTMHA